MSVWTCTHSPSSIIIDHMLMSGLHTINVAAIWSWVGVSPRVKPFKWRAVLAREQLTICAHGRWLAESRHFPFGFLRKAVRAGRFRQLIASVCVSVDRGDRVTDRWQPCPVAQPSAVCTGFVP
jgi:hypothetical protein